MPKSISQLTLVELRKECQVRNLSTTGSKADLEIRLAGHLRENGIEPANVRFATDWSATDGQQVNNSAQPHTLVYGTVDDTNKVPIAHKPDDLDDVTIAQIPGGDMGNQNLFQSTANPLDTTNTNNVFESAAAQLESLQKSIREGDERNSLELRLTALEVSMTKFFEEQRRTSHGMRRTQFDVANQQQQLHEPLRPPTHTLDYSYARGRYVNNNPPVFDSDTRSHINPDNNRFDDTSGRTFYARNTINEQTVYNQNTRTFSSVDPRVHERSVLIPYEDLRAARASLPEFSGTRAEDPVRFLENTESVLTQANIPMSGWCRAVEPQLKGMATTWWKSIKVLDLSWNEFRVEFLENFDNDEIKLRLRADILSTQQPATQTLTEFIVIKTNSRAA